MEENSLIEIYRASIYGLLAAFGGLVAYLCNMEAFSLKEFFIKGISSGFAGFLIGMLCIYFELPSSMAFCISGTFGYLGAEVTIALLKKVILKQINNHT